MVETGILSLSLTGQTDGQKTTHNTAVRHGRLFTDNKLSPVHTHANKFTIFRKKERKKPSTCTVYGKMHQTTTSVNKANSNWTHWCRSAAQPPSHTVLSPRTERKHDRQPCVVKNTEECMAHTPGGEQHWAITWCMAQQWHVSPDMKTPASHFLR